MTQLDTEVTTNPFVTLRLRSGLSHVELGKAMYVSKQALIRLEQGMFEDPLPNVMEYWVQKGESELVLRDQYIEFQQQVRKSNGRCFGDIANAHVGSTKHPFAQCRDNATRGPINKTEAARRMCVPQSTLQRWETNWRNQKTVPRSIQSALLEMGYFTSDVNTFNKIYFEWRKRMSERSGVKLVR